MFSLSEISSLISISVGVEFSNLHFSRVQPSWAMQITCGWMDRVQICLVFVYQLGTIGTCSIQQAKILLNLNRWAYECCR